jgi:hypothetical protein
MTPSTDTHRVDDLAALSALYGGPGDASIRTEIDHHPRYRAIIEAALNQAGIDGAAYDCDWPGWLETTLH